MVVSRTLCPVHSTHEQWELIDGLYHCHRHNPEPFERGEVCHACSSDPGPRIDVIAQAIDDTEARAAESEIQTAAKMCKRTAEELLEGTAQERLAAPKFYDTYLKAMRLWREMRSERLAVARDAALIEHDRRVSGLRGSN
jgi:hypothetical protein